MKLALAKDLAPLKTAAKQKIDAEAEAERARYLTPGSGQALEYKRTQEEADRWAADPDPAEADYPMLVAERDALIDSGADPAATLASVVTQVQAEAAQWIDQVGPAIKRLRRTHKMRVDAATTPAEIDMAATVDWSGVSA